MICVTRFNGTIFYLNADLVQTIEATPDTVITLINNTKIIVKEPAKVVIERIVDYQRLVHNPGLNIHSGE
jgi:flagellar protein FlbD